MTIPLLATAQLGVKAAGIAADALSGVTKKHGGADPHSKIKKTATEFETMFLEQMLDRMTKSEGTDGPLGENGTGGDVWRSMLSQEYAKTITKSGGVGISNQIMKSMIDLQAGVKNV
jgi:peptidoglycan hydrolase FlgJ